VKIVHRVFYVLSMTNSKKIRQKILDAIVSPRTAAWLKMGIAVIGVVSAFNELRSAEHKRITYDQDDV